ncbi:MAG: ATP-binding protein [Lysobacterales bacterium]
MRESPEVGSAGAALRHALAGAWRVPGVIVLIAVLLTLALDAFTRVRLPAPQQLPIRVERLLSDAEQPPAGATGWVPVTLPDRAPLRAEAPLQRAWYRLSFAGGPAPARLQALLLRRPVAALRIHVDGTLIGDSGVDRRPLPIYRSDLRYNIPPALWRAEGVEVLVLSVSRQGQAGLGEVLIADSAELAAYKSARNWIDKTLPGHSVLISVVLAIAFAAFWLARRREAAFAWLAAALLLRALFTQLGIQQTPWFDWPELYRCLIYFSLLGFIYCELEFSRVLLPLPGVRRERQVRLLFGLIAALLLLLSLLHSSAYVLVGALLAVPAALVVGALIVWRLLRHARTQPPALELHALAILAGVMWLIGVRDWLYDLHLLGPDGSGRYLHYLTPVAFTVFGGMLLRRHLAALDAAELLNRTLEARVAAKSAELERTWQHIATVERERARFEERDRLMRDMHDGVGGHLVQALAMADAGQPIERVREAVQYSLDDLRLLIDASDIHVERLNDVYARFRERVARRLTTLGIRLDWDFTQMPELPRLAPERTIQLLRILQELLTNTVKHAGARCIRIDCQLLTVAGAPAQLMLDVADDGRGFDPGRAAPGRGLDNLRQRARLLGGTLHLTTRPGAGCHARLVMPLAADEV